MAFRVLESGETGQGNPMPKLVVTFVREDFRAARSRDMVAEMGQEFTSLNSRNAKLTKRGFPQSQVARRPEHGYVVGQQTPSAISVVGRNGVPLNLWANAGATSNEQQYVEFSKIGGHLLNSRTSDFLLERVSIGSMEKQQVVETFGEPYMFFFGEHVKVLRGFGYLLNTLDYPWLTEWIYNWDNLFRGTKLVENDARAYLKVGTTVYEGYFAEYDYTQMSVDEYKVPFNFTFLVSHIIDVAQQNAATWETTYIAPEIAALPREKTELEKTLATLKKGAQAVVGTIWKDAFNTQQMGTDMALAVGSVAFDALSSIELRGAKRDQMSVAQLLGLDSAGAKGALSLGTVMNQAAGLAAKITHIARTGSKKEALAFGMGTTGDFLTGMSTGKSGFDTPGGAFVSNFMPTGSGVREGSSTVIPRRL